MKNRHIVLDCETGGLTAYENPITQLALQAVDNENLSLLEKYSDFVKPYHINEAIGDKGYIISPEALQRTHVTMTQINAGIDSKLLVKNLVGAFTKNTIGSKIRFKPVLVGHNLAFDMLFLEVLFALQNKDLYDYIEKYFVDTMKEMQRKEGIIKNKADKVKYDLTSCCERMGIKFKNAHGAPADVDVTTKLFIKLTQQMRNVATVDVEKEKATSTGELRERTFEM